MKKDFDTIKLLHNDFPKIKHPECKEVSKFIRVDGCKYQKEYDYRHLYY